MAGETNPINPMQGCTLNQPHMGETETDGVVDNQPINEEENLPANNMANDQNEAECIHCKTRLAKAGTGTTTTYKRHLESCAKRKQYQRAQQLLNFQPETFNGDNTLHPFIAPDTKYDSNKAREAIANWIMGTEQPFTVVEDDLYTCMMKRGGPMYQKISRATAKADCFKVYEHEIKKLKGLTKTASKISLTTDCWKSSHQKIEYMVITGHFIDQNWRLQKRVLSFVHVPPPRTGLDIVDGIYKCLREWEIEEKIFSISVDNAAYNDRVVNTLKTNFSKVKKLPCGGRLFHVRCCAHILNLLVKDGLSKIHHVIEEVREAVKYINHSEARRQTFSNAAHQLQVHDRKLLVDVPTRWNSTYDMLSLALKFKDVFPRYAEYEPLFHHLPSETDCDYPTSNLYLIEVYKVKETLDKAVQSKDEFIREMAKKMKEKFDKYWGECHLLMAIASVLDPRFKMKLVQFSYPRLYSPTEATKNIKEVEKALEDMYSDYLEMHNSLVREASTHGSGSSGGSNACVSNEDASGWEAYGQFIESVDVEGPEKSELAMYLEEGVHRVQGQAGMQSFNALEWWKIHKLKYRVLSQMAMDVLAIPISTVASESTFSAGGRVIDPYRSLLGADTVQMFICGRDWIRQMYGTKQILRRARALLLNEPSLSSFRLVEHSSNNEPIPSSSTCKTSRARAKKHMLERARARARASITLREPSSISMKLGSARLVYIPTS
ncbi:hypothetical protein OSB04_031785 [Centaurea solstitialis]|uniref:Transposase n=1 Tax=Centaurea solstitialis TaxID=347529 RepID=A0AA38STP9_9ASTR|nr:hypothetical protein OSB04_031785 [Centaurea solstitialis]